MEANIKIRGMIPSDLQHVGPLYKNMISETRAIPYPRIDDIDKEIEDFSFFAMRTLRGIIEGTIPQSWLALVAVDGGVTKGFLMGGLCNRIVGSPKNYFLGEVLYVTPNFRKKGIAESLVRTASEWAVANGAGALEVTFNPGSPAHKQWSRMGFRSYTGVAVFATKDFQPILDYPQFRNSNGENSKTSGGDDRQRNSTDTDAPIVETQKENPAL